MPSVALACWRCWRWCRPCRSPVPSCERLLRRRTRGGPAWYPDAPQGVEGDVAPAGVPVPAATLSQDPDASLRTAAQLAAAWLLFQAVLGSGTGYQSLRRLALLTVANASLLTLFSIAQALAWNGKIYGIRETRRRNGWFVGGPFVSHNHLAAYLNLAFGLALGVAAGHDSEDPSRRVRSDTPRSAAQRCVALGRDRGGAHLRGHHRLALARGLSGGGDLDHRHAHPPPPSIGPARGDPGRDGGRVGTVPDRDGKHLALRAAGHDQGCEPGRIQRPDPGLGGGAADLVVVPRLGDGPGELPRGDGLLLSKAVPDKLLLARRERVSSDADRGGIVGLALALLAVATIARLGRRALDAASTPPSAPWFWEHWPAAWRC